MAAGIRFLSSMVSGFLFVCEAFEGFIIVTWDEARILDGDSVVICWYGKEAI
jgi:hypothetical protein